MSKENDISMGFASIKSFFSSFILFIISYFYTVNIFESTNPISWVAIILSWSCVAMFLILSILFTIEWVMESLKQ